MKRIFVPLLLLFAAAMSCPVPPVVSHPVLPIVKVLPAQTPAGGLEVQGEGVRTITQVSAFPVFIKAPPGADLYLWKYLPGWSVVDDSSAMLTIKDAPKGELTVSVLTWKVDWDAKKTIKQTYTTTIAVGDIVPVPPGPTPPGPNPPTPPAPDILVQTMTAGLYHDGKTPENLDKCKKLAATFRVLASTAKADQSITTNAKMFELLVGSVRNTIAKTDLVQTYDAIGSYLNSKLPTTVDTPINRDLWSSELTNVANALEGLK